MESQKVTLNQPLTKEELKEVFISCLEEFSTKQSQKDYTKKQFSELISKSCSWIDSERRGGRLKWYKLGSEIRIPHTEYRRLIQKGLR